MTQILSNITDLLSTQIEQHRNKPFLKAVMAACALVATANGKVSLYQRMKIDQMMETQPRLKIFDPHDGIDLFNEYIERLQNDVETAHRQLCEIIKDVIDCEETADCLIQLCQTILQKKNQTGSVAQIEIKTLCDLLGAHHKHDYHAGSMAQNQ
ncbi:MAG: hypothetical protein V3V18_09780 [Methylococcales bacterium]